MSAQYRTVLVTGSGGVLGYALRAVAEEYPDTRFVFSTRHDADLRDPADTDRLVARVRPNAIIHLAAVSGGVALSQAHPATLLRDNTLMTLSVLEAARRLNISKTLMTLSSGMYPPNVPLPLKESDVHAGPAHESNYGYSYAKRLIEPAIRAYRTEFGTSVIGLVPNAIFGPCDKFKADNDTFIASMLRRFMAQRGTSDEVVVWGDGSPARELSYSEDLARAFLWCLENYDASEILNVGNTEELTIRELAYFIAEALQIDGARIQFDTTKPSGVQRKSMDTTKFSQLSGFRFTPFPIALAKTVAWLDGRQGILV